MSQHDAPDTSSAILRAIQAKRDRSTERTTDIAAFESSLLADIATFDLDAAEKRAQQEHVAASRAGMSDPQLVFPALAPNRSSASPATAKPQAKSADQAALTGEKRGGLLDQLRQQADVRQRELHSALAQRTSSNVAIDQALNYLFFYLHDFVQQLNVVKPEIPREYVLLDTIKLNRLNWQEGFSDYRKQSQGDGALIELVTFSYALSSPGSIIVEREGLAIERFRTQLFDFGLQFTCKEFRNQRRFVERAEFEIQPQISVNARWKADFDKGVLILETRNLERLGSAIFTISPLQLDDALLDEFGRLILGQPNQFRELARR